MAALLTERRPEGSSRAALILRDVRFGLDDMAGGG
jgi:hypothetical protein